MVAIPIRIDRERGHTCHIEMSSRPRTGLPCEDPDGGGTMGKVIASITTSVDGYVTGP
ncbi:MAG: hypothetical protein QOE01_1623, partial [Actinomycetota bacterium]|nr:hypothetical protein [Actinomycetota bacterium]